jgi:site-specific recombinase XerD
MSEEELNELKAIRKLLTASLLRDGVDAQTVSEILGHKSKSSITNEFPVRKLQEKSH